MSLAQLQTRKAKTEAEIKQLKKRIKGIDGIHADVKSDFANNVSACQKRADKMLQNLSEGLNGSGVNDAMQQLWAEFMLRQRNAVLDTERMDSAASGLAREKSRCQQRISELNAALRSIERETATALEAAKGNDGGGEA